jgi:hypothetical protein
LSKIFGRFAGRRDDGIQSRIGTASEPFFIKGQREVSRITVLRADPDDPLRKTSLGKMDIGNRRHRENSVETLRRHDPPERPDMRPIIPEAQQTTSLMAHGKPMLLHLDRNRKGRIIAAHYDEVYIQAHPDPPIA